MNKVAFGDLRAEMSHFLDFANVEQEIEQIVQQKISEALLSKAVNGSRPRQDVLADYLAGDASNQERLRLIVRLAGGSEERMKRIFASWGETAPLKEILQNSNKRKRIAAFLNDPNSESAFVPQFIKANFCLPHNWMELLKDEEYMARVARGALLPKYSAKMGFELERRVAEVVTSLGLSWEKGAVEMVNNKEVDLAIPNTATPQVQVMVSYSLTTSSSQTQRANEQASMYSSVQNFNRSRVKKGKDCVFVNVLDGGGWIERKNDLEILWKNCDHCFCYNTLGKFQSLLKGIFHKK